MLARETERRGWHVPGFCSDVTSLYSYRYRCVDDGVCIAAL
jgi:hypothetical protein